MKTIHRNFKDEEDYWRIREFLRQVYLLNGRREFSWHVSTFDYTRFHMFMNCFHIRLEDAVHLWETASGEIAGVVLPIDPGSAHFQAHPLLRTRELEEEMLDVAEEHLTAVSPDGSKSLSVWATEGDLLRLELLEKRGYKRGEWPEYKHYLNLDAAVKDAPLASGYTIRSLGDGLELLERCYASGLGFHEGDIRVAVDNRNDPGWYRNIQNAPLYRRDLDIVAVAPDGAIAAFCTAWFDDVTRSGVFEPVACVPAHQRRGLARAVMTEGLRRLQRMGAVVACVGGFSREANTLYSVVVSPECDLYGPWIRQW
jgi:ribosomal protein S18 acetylase RimI-like enzyme